MKIKILFILIFISLTNLSNLKTQRITRSYCNFILNKVRKNEWSLEKIIEEASNNPNAQSILLGNPSLRAVWQGTSERIGLKDKLIEERIQSLENKENEDLEVISLINDFVNIILFLNLRIQHIIANFTGLKSYLLEKEIISHIISLLKTRISDDKTPMHWGMANNHTKPISILFSIIKKIDPENFKNHIIELVKLKNDFGNTPLHWIADHNCTESELGLTPLHAAAAARNGVAIFQIIFTFIMKIDKDGSFERILSLLNIQDVDDKTPLYVANLLNDQEIICFVFNFIREYGAERAEKIIREFELKIKL